MGHPSCWVGQGRAAGHRRLGLAELGGVHGCFGTSAASQLPLARGQRVSKSAEGLKRKSGEELEWTRGLWFAGGEWW
jgi:hypothetical protein